MRKMKKMTALNQQREKRQNEVQPQEILIFSCTVQVVIKHCQSFTNENYFFLLVLNF